MAEVKTGTTGAARNLKTAWASPAAKVGVCILVAVLILVAAAAFRLLRQDRRPAGDAEVEAYSVQGKQPRGGVDAATVSAVERRADETADLQKSRGESFGGPFVFEGASESRGLGQSSGFDETPGKSPVATRQAGAVIAELKAKAAEYDATETASRSSGANGQSQAAASSQRSGGGNLFPPPNNSGPGQGQGPQGQGANGAMTQESFAQYSNQLNAVGRTQMQYASLPNGILSRNTQQPSGAPSNSASGGGIANGATGAAYQQTSSSTGTAAPQTAGSSSLRVRGEEVAARAGDICGATPEASVNTDYTVPVFFELLDCGRLTGARVKGSVQKAPDDFTIQFTTMTLDPKRGFKLLGPFEAVAVSVQNDGSPGIADEVDRHWTTRLGSSALLALARTERNFLSARGTTAVSTGVSSQVTIAPLSADEKRSARVAGLLEGGMDVVSRDLSYGINRAATMKLSKSSLVGVQFLNDVKVVPNEQ